MTMKRTTGNGRILPGQRPIPPKDQSHIPTDPNWSGPIPCMPGDHPAPKPPDPPKPSKPEVEELPPEEETEEKPEVS